jgi:hypothetical protein
VPEHLDPDIAELEGRGDGGGECGQLGLHVAGLLEPLGEAGHDVVPISSSPDQHPPDRGTQPGPHRPVRRHGDQEHQQRDLPLVELRPDDLVESRHECEVQGHHAGADGGVHERATHQGVHVGQVRAEDADRDRHSGDGEAEHESGGRRQALRDDERQRREDDAHDRGPGKPAELVTLEAAGVALAQEEDDDRDRERQQGQGAADTQQDGERVVGEGQRGHPRVDRDGFVPVQEVLRREPERQRQGHRHRDDQLADDAQPAGREVARRIEHEQQGQRDQQDGAELVDEPRREADERRYRRLRQPVADP